MPVDDINNTNPILTAILQNRVQTSVPLAASPLDLVKNPVAVAVSAAQNLTAAQQNELLGTETSQTLNLTPSSPAEPLLANGTTSRLTTVLGSEGLSPAQQAALAVNEPLQNLVESKTLTAAQQAALTLNQTTQTFEASLASAGNTSPAATTAGTAQNPPQAPGETPTI